MPSWPKSIRPADLGLFLFDLLTGGMRKVVAPGDTIEVGSGDLRTVAFIDFDYSAGNQDGRDNGLNNLSNLVFWVGFDDNSEAIVQATDACGGSVDVNGVATDPAVRNRFLDGACLQDTIAQAGRLTRAPRWRCGAAWRLRCASCSRTAISPPRRPSRSALPRSRHNVPDGELPHRAFAPARWRPFP